MITGDKSLTELFYGSFRNQVCNSCAAHATSTTLEYCLCLAGEEDVTPRWEILMNKNEPNYKNLIIDKDLVSAMFISNHCVQIFMPTNYVKVLMLSLLKIE